MKTLLLILSLCISAYAQDAMEWPQISPVFDVARVIDGKSITGVIQVKHKVKDRRVINLDMSVIGEPLAGTIERFAQNDELTILEHLYRSGVNWADSTREEIVQVGRTRRNSIFLFEGPRSFPAARVDGYIVYNDTEDKYRGNLMLTYIDPVTQTLVIDRMQGSVKLSNADGNKRTYEIAWVVKPKETDSDDDPFVGRIEGLLTSSSGKDGVITEYNISSKNVTATQVFNFCKWWISCCVPMRHEK